MINAFTDKFIAQENSVKANLACSTSLPRYEGLAALAGKTVGLRLEHSVALGSYQGEFLFLFTRGDDAYTSTTSYGSCSGCDTLESIGDATDGKLNPNQVRDLYILTLDIVRGMKRVAGYGTDD